MVEPTEANVSLIPAVRKSCAINVMAPIQISNARNLELKRSMLIFAG